MAFGFVYIWTCDDNRYYIGSHQGTIDDGYISSSRILNNEDLTRWTREIVAQGEISDMRKLEEELLSELNAVNDPLCINQANGGGSKIVFKEIKQQTHSNCSDAVKYMLTLVEDN